MYPFEFEILWTLGWAGEHPRTAGDIAAVCPRRRNSRDARSLAPTLVSLERRGLLRRVGSNPTLWDATLKAREIVNA